MLRGSYTTQIDEKGRIKVPAAFRRAIEDKYGSPDFYLTSLAGESVRVYPMAEWAAIEERLNQLPSMDPIRRKFLDRTNYYGQVAALDGQGRVLVPAGLRASAELIGEVVVFGYLTYLEVWCHEKFQARLVANPFTIDDEAALARLGI